MRTKASNQNRFMRIITLPIRALTKARDFYVRSMTDAAGRVSYGNVMGVGSAQNTSLPKSFSVSSSRPNSDGDDLRELIRAASARTGGSLGNRAEMDLYLQHQMRRRSTPTPAEAVVPRSCSVGMGRIDENAPCEFGEENFGGRAADLVYPRSRSYAVTKRSVVF